MKWRKSNIVLSLVLTACVFILSESLRAQTPLFKKLEVQPKISETEIFFAEQDSLGHLWLGTNKGILRFDGVASKQVDLPDSLRFIQVTALKVGKKNVVAGLANGCFVNISKKNFSITSIQKISDSEITALLWDENDSIWAGTNGDGIKLVSSGAFRTFNIGDGLADNFVHSLQFVNHQLAIGTDLGLTLCRFENNRLRCHSITSSDGLPDNLITSLLTNGKENILLGMQNGTVCNLNTSDYHIDLFESMNLINTSPILKILALQDEILVITESNGAFIVNRNNLLQVQQFQITEEGKTAKKPKDALVDSEGNLILVFGNHEITIADFRLQFIRQHEEQIFANAKCLMSDHLGNIWFANDQGIFRHPGEFSNDQTIEQFYKCTKKINNIVAICEGLNNDVWFGTFGNGLGHIDTKKSKIYTEEDGLVNNNVLSIILRDSTLWMATLGGASTLRLIDKEPVFAIFDSQTKLGSNFIYAVFNDSKNRLWLGTDGRGPAQYEHGVFTFLQEKFPQLGKSVIAIAEDEHGNIWFNSTDKGLQWTDMKTLNDVELNTKTEKVEVFAIQSDPFGNIVALTSAGIAVLSNHNEHISFLKTGFDVVVNYLNVITRDIKGRLWLGTENALIRYSDYSLGKKMKPRPYIESIDLMLVPIDTARHEFNFDENHFTFNLSSIWFQEPEAIQFQYKLVGYDTNWVTTRDRKVIFSQLQPGNYLFQLRSSNNEDWVNATITTYRFKINFPYWRMPWFFATIFFIVVALIWIIIRIRINRLKTREILAREKVQSQFDTLRNQVNPHFIFNSFNTLISIIGSDQNAAIGYVEKLSDYFRIVLEQRDKDVIQLKDELELVNSYLYLQKQRFGSNLNISLDVGENLRYSLIPPLTLQLLVENAIKHNVISKARPLTISIIATGDKIIVANNIQPKLTKEPSTGIGLENIKHRYAILFKQEISILNAEDQFIVTLPVIIE